MTTSPVNTSANTQANTSMSAAQTNADLIASGSGGAALALPTSAVDQWRAYGRFVRQPFLPDAGAMNTGAKPTARAVGRLLGLDMMFMLAFIGLVGLAAAFGFEMPDNVNNNLEPGIGMFLMIALLVPIAEELVFRSWLSGRPPVIAAVLFFVVGLGSLIWGGSMVQASGGAGSSLGTFLSIMGPALAIIGAPLCAALLLKKPVPAVFARRFAIFYWFSVVSFALVHLANYTEGTLVVLLPLVLPQFVLGTMLGYLRVHHGLIAAIALHAAHNAILIGFVMLGAGASS